MTLLGVEQNISCGRMSAILAPSTITHVLKASLTLELEHWILLGQGFRTLLSNRHEKFDSMETILKESAAGIRPVTFHLKYVCMYVC